MLVQGAKRLQVDAEVRADPQGLRLVVRLQAQAGIVEEGLLRRRQLPIGVRSAAAVRGIAPAAGPGPALCDQAAGRWALARAFRHWLARGVPVCVCVM